jgi:hypothetical protein
MSRWLPDERVVACYNGNVRCPAHVTPLFLEEGKNQGVCSAERDIYYCNVICTSDGQVKWEGGVCPVDLVSPCPPWKRTLVPEFAALTSGSGAGDPTALHGPEPQPVPATAHSSPEEPKSALRGGVDKTSGEYLLSIASDKDKEYIATTGGFDLRGVSVSDLERGRNANSLQNVVCFLYACPLNNAWNSLEQCEEKDGAERCFYEDAEGRELCPPHVTAALLTGGAGQYLCLAVRVSTSLFSRLFLSYS